MKSAWTTLRALIYVALFLWLWVWISLMMRRYDDALGVLPAWTVALGWLLLACGAALDGWCVGVFIARGQGTPAPFDAPRVFVAVGPYRYTRNPMYGGAFLMLAGFGFVQHSPAMAAFAVPWLLVVHLAVVTLEEPDLRRKLGASYEEYTRRVHRWIPHRPE